MLQKDDLKQVVSELVEELVGKKSQPDLTSEESDEYYIASLMKSKVQGSGCSELNV